MLLCEADATLSMACSEELWLVLVYLCVVVKEKGFKVDGKKSGL
jgi:hypothetical protein